MDGMDDGFIVQSKPHTMRQKFLQLLTGMLILVITGFVGLEIITSRHVERVEAFNDVYGKAIYGDSRQALVDFNGKRISRKVEVIFSNPAFGEGDSLVVFMQKGKQGYMSSRTGEIVIAAGFDRAWKFDAETHLAAVGIGNRLGFINTRGDVVIPAQYPYFSEDFMDDVDIIFRDGLCEVPNLNKFGLINQRGEEILPAIYRSISAPCNGFRIVMTDDKAGLFDTKTGRIIWPLCFEYLDFTEKGIVVTETQGKYTCKYMVSYDLRNRFPVYDDVHTLYTGEEDYESDGISGEGVYSGYSTFTVDGWVGVLDDGTGKELFSAQFEEVTYYAKGRFKVAIGEYTGIIDLQGNMVGKEDFTVCRMNQIPDGVIIPEDHE